MSFPKLIPMKTLLKKAALIFAGALLFGAARATIIKVTVQNFSFSPASFTANIGDTVKWVWVAGTHTTTSLTIPGGAASWNNPVTSTDTVFEYKITTAGTYNYWCAIHTTMMEGSFTVGPTGVNIVSKSSGVFAKLYPNPASHVLNIHLNNTPNNNSFIVTDVQGKVVLKTTLTNEDNAINISEWGKGIYFYMLKNSDEEMKGKFEVQ